MKHFYQFLEEAKKGRCWTGYKPVPGKEPFSPGSCKKVSEEAEEIFDMKEDGEGASAGPTNVVGQGAIAGTGGKGGEPGVSKKRNPVMSLFKRKQPKGM
jgi:hypothetical protein